MSITKEQLRSLIREQMNNVSEVADEYTPMMPPKPVKPKGIAGTDLPMSALSDGIDAVIKKLKKMYAPGSREYENVMNLLNIINDHGGLQESDVEEGLTKAQAAEEWEKMNQARRDREAKERGLPADDSIRIDITDKPNQAKVTKEHLQRIIKEELEGVLSEYGSVRARQRYKQRYGPNRTLDALGNRIGNKPAPRAEGRDDAIVGDEKRSQEDLGYDDSQYQNYVGGYDDGLKWSENNPHRKKHADKILTKRSDQKAEETSVNEQ
jgi:hypothetical protein